MSDPMTDATAELLAKVLVIGIVWVALLATVAVGVELFGADRGCERIERDYV